jgi:two-component system, cell cycle sensor histidine kinase and response regulator CckA
LLNISVNARDAMPQGGRLLVTTRSLESGAAQAIHRDATANLYVGIMISDTGMGMEEEVRSRIFEPFFTTKGVGEGTGLGLSMVYGIVRNHNGLVDVETSVGRGSTFRILLPVTQETAPIELHERKPPLSDLVPCQATVLVVEDEEPMVRLLENALSKAGYRSLLAMDGSQALELYSRCKNEVDIVLMDLGLPKTSGSEVIRTIKSQNRSAK